MRAIPLLLLALTLPVCGQEFRARREALKKALPDAVVVLFGRTEKEAAGDRHGFFQEANFQYLTGWSQPDAVALLTPRGDTLFLPRRDERWRRYNGPAADPEDASLREPAGFDTVAPVTQLEAHLARALEASGNFYAIAAHPATEKLRALAPLREVRDAALPIARLRMKKSAHERELIRRATEASIDAHLAAWKRAAPGVFEYQAATAFTSTLTDKGCPRPAYASIFGSGPNALILHYWQNSRRMDLGDLLLIDAGAECAGYASDLTRTIPVGGKFTARQREIYDIVLGAQRAGLAAIKPGATLGRTSGSVYQAVFDYFASHGKDRHGNSLERYLPHGVCHPVGLEVHDAHDPALPLEAGMIVALEPGLYIPEENIGIRIEDLVLVTETGSEVLSTRLPKEAAEIEKYLAK